MASRNNIDRRGTDRMNTEAFYIQYRLANDENTFTVELLNVGSGGLCFLRDSPLYKKDEVLVLFPFRSRKIIMRGEVVRVEGREVAVNFKDKSEKIDLFVNLFNEEYRSISEENKRLSKSKQSLFFEKETFTERY
jgi:hypothetical protein